MIKRLKRSEFLVRPIDSRSQLPMHFRFAQVHEDKPEAGCVDIEFLFPDIRRNGVQLYTSTRRQSPFIRIQDWERFDFNLEAAERRLQEIYGR